MEILIVEIEESIVEVGAVRHPVWVISCLFLLGFPGWQLLAQPERSADSEQKRSSLEDAGVSNPPMVAAVTGSLRWPQGQGPPQAIRLRLQPAAGDTAHAAAKVQDLACVLDGKSFSCKAPEGHFDAKLLADGFVPLYLWDLNLEAESVHQIEPWPLQAGALGGRLGGAGSSGRARGRRPG